jgi:hypothetical protein
MNNPIVMTHAEYCWTCGERQDVCPHLFSLHGPSERTAKAIREDDETAMIISHLDERGSL